MTPAQSGEAPFFVDHVRSGVALARADPEGLLLFSGGVTREAGGWSEADTYLTVARHFRFWLAEDRSSERAELEARVDVEAFARDSFENLLFSLFRFHDLTGRYPARVTIVSWTFKGPRFDVHRRALRIPDARFRFVGRHDPRDLESAKQKGAATLAAFRASPFGTDGVLAEKRTGRSFRPPDYASHRAVLAFLTDPANARRSYPGAFPWEDTADAQDQ